MGIGDWLETNVREIDEQPALRGYGIALAFLHVLTGVAWFGYKHITTLVSGEDYACWPLFPECQSVRTHLSAGGVGFAVCVYMAFGACAGVLFAVRRPRAALASFVVATALGTALYALDYRLRFNQTYMFGWIVLAFLFARHKAQVLQALLALFYVWAGTLKLNAEWLSGAALYERPFGVPDALVPAACAYVLALELVFVWALFSTRPALRWAVYAQLLLFHAVSWKIVGYFYPLLMFGLTAIFPLVWLRAPAQALAWRRRSWGTGAGAWVLGVAASFSLFQLLPHAFPGDPSLTGEGRLFALHMFDARAECAGGASLSTASGQRARVALINEKLDARTRCDPITLHAAVVRLCRSLAGRPERVRVDVAIDAKRSSEPTMHPLMHADDACNPPIEYSIWRHNAWIGER